ncbi:MAG: AAA family ATPase [bacterium]
MIPVRLTLKNFMSYGNNVPPLDFSGIHVANLTGNNGHGKSALLDAITWSIWGKARNSDRSGDELIRWGESSMRVEFEFELEGNIYRVIRERVRGKQTILEFQIKNGDEWVALTGEGGNKQRVIDQKLRMDYETFINSSFILQGRADEFTIKNPTERKKILGDILGLGFYDDLERKAREKLRDVERELSESHKAIEDIEKELRLKPECEENVSSREERIRNLERELSERRDALQELDRRRRSLEELEDRLNDIKAQLANNSREIEEIEGEQKRISEEIRRKGEIISEKPEVMRLLDRRREVAALKDDLDRRRDRFDELSNKKNSLEREIERKRNLIERDIQAMGSRLEQFSAWERDASDILSRREEIERNFDVLMRTRRELEARESQAVEFSQLREKRSEIEKKILEIESEARAEIQSIINRIEEIEGRMVSLAEEVDIEDLRDLKRRSEELKSFEVEREKVGRDLQEATSALASFESLVRQKRERLRELEGERDAFLNKSVCPLCGQAVPPEERERMEGHYASNIESLISEIHIAEGEEEAHRHRIDSLLEKYREMGEKLEARPSIERRIAELEAKFREWKASEETLGDLRKDLAGKEADLKEGHPTAEWRRALADIDSKAEALGYSEDDHKRLREEENRLREYEFLREQLQKAENIIREIERERPPLQSRRDELISSLKDGRYAHEEFAALRDLEGKIEDLKYDREEYQRIVQELKDLEEVPRRMVLIEEAERTIEADREALRRSLDRAERARKVQEALSSQRDSIAEELKDLDPLRQRIRSEEATIREKEGEENRVREELGRFKEKLENCIRLEGERKDKQALIKKLSSDKSIYEELVTAFGKNGIQAFIIENAIPQIEEEANSILSRMTDNRMHLSLKTQDKLKTKDKMRETLSIEISDEMGTRPYELYSGGEKFRVNFALRIALSKLLASRAGARLQTLVIDEGFGSQDDQGRERLVQAINSISEDFERILVITHIQELKDAFPIRIEIDKDEDGSHFTIVES